MLAAEIDDDSVCRVLLESNQSSEVICNESQSQVVKTAHSLNHTTDLNLSLRIVSVKSDHSHALPVVFHEKQVDSNLPKENSNQNLPSFNFSRGKEVRIKNIKFSLNGKEGVGPEDHFLGGTHDPGRDPADSHKGSADKKAPIPNGRDPKNKQNSGISAGEREWRKWFQWLPQIWMNQVLNPKFEQKTTSLNTLELQ